jgi:hypothetical protein
MVQKLLKSIGLLCAGALLLGLAFFIFFVPRFDSVSFRPGSISAMILVGATIGNFPVIEPMARPDITYSAASGAKPETVTLFYRTKADTQSLIDAATRYLAALGFKEQPRAADALIFKKGEVHIRFKIEVTPAGIGNVSVAEFQGPIPAPTRPAGTATAR